MTRKTIGTIALAGSLLLGSCSEQPKSSVKEKEEVSSELFNELKYLEKEYVEGKTGEVKYPSKYDTRDRFDENGHLISKEGKKSFKEKVKDSLDVETDEVLELDSLKEDSIKIDSLDNNEVEFPIEEKLGLVAENTRKEVYLTIDDGPGAYTQEIAEELYKRGHRATFFLVGSNIKENRYEAMRNAEEMGHEFGNHSFSHANFKKIPLSKAKEELSNTKEAITAAGVKAAPYFRFPYGNSYPGKESFEAYMKSMGYEDVFWNIDTRDWSKSTTKKDLIRCLEKVKQGDVILIHERVYTKDRTIPTIDSVLKSKGFVSVPYRKKGH